MKSSKKCFPTGTKRAAAVKNLELQFAGMVRAELTTVDELLSRRKVSAFCKCKFETKKKKLKIICIKMRMGKKKYAILRLVLQGKQRPKSSPNPWTASSM